MAKHRHIVPLMASAVLTLAVLPPVAMAQSTPGDTQPAASAAPTTQPAAWPIPITFARSGRQTEILLLPVPGGRGRIEKEVVLAAFGRVWSDPADVVQTSAVTRTTMMVPNVRVPTVFSIVDRGQRIVGELAAYPDRDAEWDRKIVLYSAGAPEWFDQWAKATGLPVKQALLAELSAFKPGQADEDSNRLLILGRAAAGKAPADLLKLAREKGINILALDAEWFGEPTGPVGVAPKQMHEGLSEIAKQRWPQPLEFASHRQPWGGIANRWAWVLDGNGLPLVERVGIVSATEGGWTYDKPEEPDVSGALMLSYLHLERLLGRSESADAALLALLGSAAKAGEQAVPGHPLEFIHPARDRLDPSQRPVLSAARSVEPRLQDGRKPEYNPPIYAMLDLRGEARPPNGQSLPDRCKQAIEGQPVVRLLILGDDRMLDEWEWLKLDRAKKRMGAAGVQWLPDDELPPSKASQVRLMLKLTELGVPLAPPGEEEKKK